MCKMRNLFEFKEYISGPGTTTRLAHAYAATELKMNPILLFVE